MVSWVAYFLACASFILLTFIEVNVSAALAVFGVACVFTAILKIPFPKVD